MAELRALIFDFDGTIAESERFGHRVAYNEAFEELGLAERWDEDSYGAWLAVAGGRERLEAFYAQVRPELSQTARTELARRIHEVKRRRFDAIGRRLTPRAGVVRLIEEAVAANVRLAIATTAAPEGVAAFFAGRPALGEAFDIVVAGDEVARKKPAPDAYLLALERLGCVAGEAVALEDSAIGLRAARAAGLVTLVTPSGYTAGEDFSGAAAVLEELGDPEATTASLFGPTPARGYADLAYLRRLLAETVR